MHAQIENGSGQFHFFQTIRALAAFDGLGIRQLIRRVGHVKRHGQEEVVQTSARSRFRIDAIHVKPGRPPSRIQPPGHAPLVPRPNAAHIRHARARAQSGLDRRGGRGKGSRGSGRLRMESMRQTQRESHSENEFRPIRSG